MSTHGSAGTAGPLTLSRGDALLRLALKLDAAVTGLNGAAYVAATPVLADLLGLPAGLLRGVGAFLLVYAAAVWVIATRAAVRPAAVWAVIAINAAWAVDSVTAAALGWGSPTTPGRVWIVLQAIAVAGFAALQWAALRRQA